MAPGTLPEPCEKSIVALGEKGQINLNWKVLKASSIMQIGQENPGQEPAGLGGASLLPVASAGRGGGAPPRNFFFS